ncbi:MAG TPA: site-specific integrase [Solirubrobacteraceae bacterium]|nr:site-specific integrase [Solirubrobacteraceae bacterium]
MNFRPPQPISGHVFRREGARQPVWYAKYRLPDGRQIQRRIGPAWAMRGRPAEGFYTRRTAQAWLDQVLAEARRGELPGMMRTGATFKDAVAEYMRWLEHDRARKPTTLRGYRSIMHAHLLPTFGERRLEDITTGEVEAWSATLAARGLANATRLRILTCLHGVMARAKRVWKLPRNPITDVEKPTQRHTTVELDVFTPEEVHALVRAAASEQDAAIFLTAACTGLRRGELIALRWRSVDFTRRSIRVVASYSERSLATPKSGRARSVPMAPPVAQALARLGSRDHNDQPDDLVFPGAVGEYLDGSALYRRYKLALKHAGLRSLRFHDLRHTFGTQVISNPDVSILQLKTWMGHADIDTTMKYLHYAPRDGEADLITDAFAPADPSQPQKASA